MPNQGVDVVHPITIGDLSRITGNAEAMRALGRCTGRFRVADYTESYNYDGRANVPPS